MSDDKMKPALPGLELVFTIKADIDAPMSAGPAPHGERLHIPITGGQVSGPRLTGKILPGGSDWPLIAPDGTSRIEARYTILTDDGIPILVMNKGMRVSSLAVRDRMRAGEIIPPTDYYMRAAPVFDAPSGPHEWLNQNLFICSIAPQGRLIEIDVYRVT